MAASLPTSFKLKSSAALHKLCPASGALPSHAPLCLCLKVRASATHLYLQLLNHLHLDSALSGAAVIEGVLVVQVPKCEREYRRSQFGLEGAPIWEFLCLVMCPGPAFVERDPDPLTAGCGREVKEQS